MEDADDISVIEYIYQLNVSKLIKDNKHNNKELVTEVKKIIRRKEKRLEKMKAYVSDTAFVLQDHLQNFRHIGTRYSKSVVLLQSEDFYPYIC